MFVVRPSWSFWSGSFGLILLSLLIFSTSTSMAAKKDSGAALADKVQQLVDLTAKRAVIRLNGNKFRDYVKNSPRNYSMIVM